MTPLLWLLATCLTAAPFDNLLPGDTSFRLGYGPFTTQVEPEVDPPRLDDGELVLASPGAGGLTGPQLRLDATPPLRAGETYTFACRARGHGRLEIRADNGQGHVPIGRFEVREDWTTLQLTFEAQGEPPPEGLTYAIRVTPLPQTGLPGEIRLDDARLVFGSVARSVPEPYLAADVLTSIRGPEQAMRPGERLRFGAYGPRDMRVEARLLAPDGRDAAGPWSWSGTGQTEFDTADLANRWYRAVITAESHDEQVTVRRDVWVLPDHRLDDGPAGPFAIDAAALGRCAEARALGYRQVRVVVAWSDMVDRRGEPDFLPLATQLAPAFRQRMEVVLVVRMTPADALPKPWLTSRKMDSHGFAKGTPLPDLAAFVDWTTALGQWGFGRRLIYELDDEPFRTWHGEDYTQYLRRFATALREADPEARVAGVGEGFTVSDGAHRAAFLDEVAKRGGLDAVDRISVNLPDPVGAVPEDAMGVGVTALTEALLPGLPTPRRDLQVLRPGAVATNDQDPQALSSEQLAARLVRDWLAVWPLRPALFETGWRGGVGPREAALEVWQSRYRGVQFLHRREWGNGLVAVYGQDPVGPGVVALWDSTDRRRFASEPRLDGDGVELVLPAAGGVMLRARSLYGRELTEAYRGSRTVVAPGFSPLYLEGLSAAWLDQVLSQAVVRRHEAIAVAVWPEVRDSGPGLVYRIDNRGPAAATGEVVFGGDGHWAAAVVGTRYRLPGFAAETRFVPLRRWGAQPGVLRWMAEAGDRLEARTRRIMPLPTESRPAPVVDGVDDDWTPAGWWNLESADAMTAPSDRIGLDDASAKVRLRLDERGLHLFAEVRDDQLAANSGDVFANADGLELRLDLDLSGDAGDETASPDDYTIVFAPYVDNVFQGRSKASRGPGSGPELLRMGDVAARFRKRADGWAVEATLPLNADARQAMARAGAFGCDLLLRDVDPNEPVANLSFSGTADRDPTRWALAALPLKGVFQVSDTAIELPAAPPRLLTIGFDPDDAIERFQLRGRPGCRVRVMPQHDFIRGAFGLLVEQGEADDAAPFLSFNAPAAEAREVQIWVRGAPANPTEPLRLQASLGGELRDAEIPSEWRRIAWALPREASAIGLGVLGVGRVEVAEVGVVEVDLPTAEVTGGGRYAQR